MDASTQRRLARQTFRGIRVVTGTSNRLGLPVVSTGRPFAFYRDVFFRSRPAADVLKSLAGQRILDVGCGLTPFTSDSMFQACYAANVEFYGVDPKLAGGLGFGWFDRAKVAVTGGAHMDPNAPGEERRLGIYADDLPFEDHSVDLILSSWALMVWIADPAVLNRVFNEFSRVLKPGGQVKVYPTLHVGDNPWPDLEGLHNFDVRQYFVGRVSVLNLPPAFVSVFERKALVVEEGLDKRVDG